MFSSIFLWTVNVYMCRVLFDLDVLYCFTALQIVSIFISFFPAFLFLVKRNCVSLVGFCCIFSSIVIPLLFDRYFTWLKRSNWIIIFFLLEWRCWEGQLTTGSSKIKSIPIQNRVLQQYWMSKCWIIQKLNFP